MNKKRFSALLVCVFMLLTLFVSPTVSFAAESTNETVTDDMAMLKAIGVFPDDLVSGTPLTRHDLARIYFRILRPEEADAEFVAIDNKFSDLGDEHFAANFAAQMGIMNGYGDGTFRPDATLSYNEIIKTIVCFLGYEDVAESKGGYPMGYIICATDMGLDRYADSGNIVSTDIAAALFMIAANEKLLEVDSISDGGISYKTSDKTYLEKYLDVYKGEGVVSANYLDDIYNNGATPDYHYINIGDKYLHLTPDTLSLRDYIGCTAEVFIKENTVNDIPDVLYYTIKDTEVYDIDKYNFAGYNHEEREISYFNEKGKEKSFDINGAYVVYNNTYCSSYDESILNPFLDDTKDSSIKLIDNNEDNEIDVVVVRSYKSYVISKIVDGKIYNKSYPNEIFDIKDFDDGEYAITNVLGETIPVSTLADGDIISVLTDAYGNIKEIVVSIDYYIGVVEKIDYNNGVSEGIYVDGKYFKFSGRTGAEFAENRMFKVGDKAKFFFDYEGRICNIETETYSQIKTGYLINMKEDSNRLLNKINVAILTSTGSILYTTLDKTVTLNGTKISGENVPDAIGYADAENNITRQIIKYEYSDTKDCITSIETVDESIDQTFDGFYEYKNLSQADLNHFRTSTKSFNTKLLISGSTNIFIVPSEENRHNMNYYDVATSSFFPDGNNSHPIKAYGSKGYNPIAEALVVEPASGMGAVGADSLNTYMVVTSADRVYEDGDILYMFTGYVKTSLKTYTCKDEDVFFVGDDGNAPDVGDVIHFGCDRDGYISAVKYIYDASAKKLADTFTTNPSDSSAFKNPRYYVADVKYFDDAAMTLEIKALPPLADVKTEHYPASGFTVYEYDDSGRIAEVKISATTALHDSMNNGYPAKVFVYSVNAVPNMMIIHHE